MPSGRKICVFVLVLSGLVGLADVTAAQRAPRPRLPDIVGLQQLSWLVGNWRSAQAGTIIEERWTSAAGGTMLAVSRTLKGGQMVGFEFLRIVERDNQLVYVAQPNGGPPVEFTLTAMNENSATFENPMHDFPRVITYTWRDDGSLQAVVSDGAQNQQTFEFTRSP